MADSKVILVTGATGHQGGAVARELLARGHRVRAMTRKPEGDASRELASQGAEVVAGNLDDEASIRKALSSAWGAFAVQNAWEVGVEGEETQGERFAKAAKEAGVQHFVYTSVASADRGTGIPHFENKFRIEETVRGLGFPSHVILRPVFFMENWLSAILQACHRRRQARHGNQAGNRAPADRRSRHRQVRALGLRESRRS